MKKLSLLSLILLPIFLIAQAPRSLESIISDPSFLSDKPTPVVKGQLLGYKVEEDSTLNIEYSLVLPYAPFQVSKKVKPQADGSFELELDNNLPYQQIWFSISDYYYGELNVHEELIITADLQQIKKKSGNWLLKGVEFSGPDAGLTETANKFIQFKRKESLELGKKIRVANSDRKEAPAERMKKYLPLYQEKIDREKAFLTKHGDEYAWLLESKRKSEHYGHIAITHWRSEMPEDLLEEYLAFEPIIVSNSSYDYYNYLGIYFKLGSDKESEEIKKSLEGLDLDEGERLKVMEKARVSNMIEKLRHIPASKACLVQLLGVPNDLNDRADYLQKIMPELQLDWAKDKAKKFLVENNVKLANVKQTLANSFKKEASDEIGNYQESLKFGADLYTSKYTSVEDFIAALHQKHPDQAFILDIWATWCGPCIDDMKNSKENKAKLTDLPIKVIYLCTNSGSNPKLWRKKIAELESSGDHIFMEEAFADSIMDFFDLRGYPSYVFIDKEGNFDRSTVSRLSSLNIKKLKEKL